jgi:hypothetical protein
MLFYWCLHCYLSDTTAWSNPLCNRSDDKRTNYLELESYEQLFFNVVCSYTDISPPHWHLYLICRQYHQGWTGNLLILTHSERISRPSPSMRMRNHHTNPPPPHLLPDDLRRCYTVVCASMTYCLYRRNLVLSVEIVNDRGEGCVFCTSLTLSSLSISP